LLPENSAQPSHFLQQTARLVAISFSKGGALHNMEWGSADPEIIETFSTFPNAVFREQSAQGGWRVWKTPEDRSCPYLQTTNSAS
jgi:hypothetical protein